MELFCKAESDGQYSSCGLPGPLRWDLGCAGVWSPRQENMVVPELTHVNNVPFRQHYNRVPVNSMARVLGTWTRHLHAGSYVPPDDPTAANFIYDTGLTGNSTFQMGHYFQANGDVQPVVHHTVPDGHVLSWHQPEMPHPGGSGHAGYGQAATTSALGAVIYPMHSMAAYGAYHSSQENTGDPVLNTVNDGQEIPMAGIDVHGRSSTFHQVVPEDDLSIADSTGGSKNKNGVASDESGSESCTVIYADDNLPEAHVISDLEANVEKSCSNSNPGLRTCVICGYCFSEPIVMVNHLRTHKAGELFLCNICGEKFEEPGHCAAHVRLHSEHDLQNISDDLGQAPPSEAAGTDSVSLCGDLPPSNSKGDNVSKDEVSASCAMNASLSCVDTPVEENIQCRTNPTNVGTSILHEAVKVMDENQPLISIRKESGDKEGHDSPEKDTDITDTQFGLVSDHSDVTMVELANKIVYACSECLVEFQDSLSLLKHFPVHQDPYDSQKKKQSGNYSTKGVVASAVHMPNNLMDTEVEPRPFKCKNCELTFRVAKTVLKHMNFCTARNHCNQKVLQTKTGQDANSNENPGGISMNYKPDNWTQYPVDSWQYKCSICGKLFAQVHDLRTHFKSHINEKRLPDICNSEGRFVCVICDCKFLKKIQLKMHQKVHTGPKPIQCEACPKTFYHVESYQRHFIINHAMKGWRRTTDSAAMDHEITSKMIKEHGSYSREHNRTLSNQEKLDTKTSGQTENSYVQDTIVLTGHGKGHNDYNQWRQTEKSALQQEPNSAGSHSEGEMETDSTLTNRENDCQVVCPSLPDAVSKRIITEQQVADIMDILRMPKGQGRTYFCSQCEGNFASGSKLIAHFQAAHGGTTYPELSRRGNLFVCSVCGFSSNTCSRLQSHIRAHTDERPFRCDVCNQMFVRVDTFTAHRQSCVYWRKRSAVASLMKRVSEDKRKKRLNSSESHTENTNRVLSTNEPVPYNENSGEKKSLKINFLCGNMQKCLKPHAKNIIKDVVEVSEAQYQSVMSILGVPASQESGMYLSCSKCFKVFPNPASLLKHFKQHDGGKVCPEMVNEDGAYICAICGMEGFARKRLQEHFRTHTGEKPFRCALCGQVFCRSDTALKHYGACLCKTRLRLLQILEDCIRKGKRSNGSSLWGRKALSVHQCRSEQSEKTDLNARNTGDSITKSPVSSQSETQASLRNQGEPEYDNAIEFCVNDTNSTINLLAEEDESEETVLPEGEQLQKKCTSELSSDQQLQSQTPDLETATSHPLAHATGQSLSSKDQSDHKLKQEDHDSVQLEPRFSTVNKNLLVNTHYLCSGCNDLFECSEDLMDHFNSHVYVMENDRSTDNDSKCAACGANFPSRYSLESHLLAHVGTAPFKCIICMDTFQEATEYDQHMMESHCYTDTLSQSTTNSATTVKTEPLDHFVCTPAESTAWHFHSKAKFGIAPADRQINSEREDGTSDNDTTNTGDAVLNIEKVDGTTVSGDTTNTGDVVLNVEKADGASVHGYNANTVNMVLDAGKREIATVHGNKTMTAEMVLDIEKVEGTTAHGENTKDVIIFLDTRKIDGATVHGENTKTIVKALDTEKAEGATMHRDNTNTADMVLVTEQLESTTTLGNDTDTVVMDLDAEKAAGATAYGYNGSSEDIVCLEGTDTDGVETLNTYGQYQQHKVDGSSPDSPTSSSATNASLVSKQMSFPFVCIICKVAFKKAKFFLTHWSKRHPGKILPPYKCAICHAIFNEVKNYAMHFSSHQRQRSESKINHTCDKCGETFHLKAQLRVHKRSHSNKGRGYYRCSQCDKILYNKQHLKLHEKNHGLRRQFKCDKCQKRFATAWILLKHKCITVETGVTAGCFMEGKDYVVAVDPGVKFKNSNVDVKDDMCPPGGNVDALETPDYNQLCEYGENRIHALSEKITVQAEYDGEQIPNEQTQLKMPTLNLQIEATEVNREDKPRVGQKDRDGSQTSSDDDLPVHSLDQLYRCPSPDCEKVFVTKHLLDRHRQPRGLKGRRKYVTCPICKSCVKDLDLHMMMHNSADGTVECKVCGKQLRNINTLKNHMITHSQERPYVCKLCDATFKHKFNLKEHELTHTDVRPFKCHLCHKAFRSKKSLTNHQPVHTGIKAFGCSECDKRFKLKKQLKLHVDFAHGNAEKTFICDICGRAHMSKGNLQKHLLVHSDVRPHVCQVCGKDFKRTTGLRKHLRIHSDAKQFKCEFCGKEFDTKKWFLVHVAKHTGDMEMIMKYYDTCTICKATFTTKQNMETHMRIHTGESPYSCYKCGQDFRYRTTWKNHLKKQHGEYPVATKSKRTGQKK